MALHAACGKRADPLAPYVKTPLPPAGLDVSQVLARNDTFSLFACLGDAVVTGPTGTNVGDIQIALVG